MNIVDELYAITAALREAGVPYAVCGGLAVTAHGAPRFTQDIDIAIAREHLSPALAAVARLGYDIPAAPMTFGEGTPKERHVQRVNKIAGNDHLVLDLLIAEAAYTGVLDDAVDVALSTGTITFVSRETLLRMKRLSISTTSAGSEVAMLDPAAVERRLAQLAAMYTPETVARGRARLHAEAMAAENIAATVAGRLEVLRALDELARFLRQEVTPSLGRR